eukprot:TRINITY_DN67227_c8_g9_i1.p1 TRINITY_DN67227_c8_g9~~TRINITY_DN67227_c8_g9_i1.p1  ORF type:complete len:284 (+),score=2.71 TRINITY_DN67227_c8_g9_i1:31-852(+)
MSMSVWALVALLSLYSGCALGDDRLCPAPELTYSFDEVVQLVDHEDIEYHYGQLLNDTHDLNQLLMAVQEQHEEVAEQVPETCLEMAIEAHHFLGELHRIGVDAHTTHNLHMLLGSWLHHSVYFQTLAAHDTAKEITEPAEPLHTHIKETYGSLEHLHETIANTALSHFGYGFVWFALDIRHSSLVVENLHGNHLPMFGHLQPILVLDMWEHAYYQRFQNKKDEYVAAWWESINWAEVRKNYIDAMKRSEQWHEDVAENTPEDQTGGEEVWYD